MTKENAKKEPAKTGEALLKSVGEKFLASLLDGLRKQKKPFPQMTENEQKNLISDLSSMITNSIYAINRDIKSEGKKFVIGNLEQVNFKKATKAVFAVNPNDDNVTEMAKGVEHAYMLTQIDIQKYIDGMEKQQPVKDEPGLFEKDEAAAAKEAAGEDEDDESEE